MVASKIQPVEVEVCGPNGQQLVFAPIGRSLRGYVDFSQAKSKSAMSLRDRWPDPIPGQVLGIGEDGAKYVREPLYEPRYSATRKRIDARCVELPPERETFDSETAETWLYWLRRAVDSGLARIIKGELPAIESFPADVKKDFIFAPRKSGPSLAESLDKMAEAIAANTAVLGELLKKLAK